MEMKDLVNEERQPFKKSETERSGGDGVRKTNLEHEITNQMLQSAEVAINVSVHLQRPLIGRQNSKLNIQQRNTVNYPLTKIAVFKYLCFFNRPKSIRVQKYLQKNDFNQ